MKELIKQLILDFHQEPIPEPAYRAIALGSPSPKLRKTQVLMGMRRTGKTWLMYQQMQQLLQKGCPKEKLLYINFEDDRLLTFNPENFQDILSAYFDLYPEYSRDPQVTFYFDEIHVAPHWEKFIRRLLDKEQMQIVVTGSSAKMLSKEIATSLRGRANTTEIFPFSFQEYLTYHKIPTDLSTKNQSFLRNAALQYLQWGGFPEMLFLEHDGYRDLLQDYVNTVVFRDVVDRYQISNLHVLKLFLLHCLQNLASSLSITKIYQTLKSMGAIVGKNSLYDYLEYFTDAYLLYPVSLFQFSGRKQQVNPKKIYTIDPGIISAYSIKADFDQWMRFENCVYMTLRREYEDIFYYKTQSGKEIDFVVLTKTGNLQLYQACISLESAITQQREVSALLEAATELKIKNSFLITLDEEKTISLNGHLIHALPFWKWAAK